MQKYLSDKNETNLRLPGPVPVPFDILNEQTKPLINHRGNEYSYLLKNCTDKLKQIFATDNDLYITTSSGTGVMEASISNFLSEGDEKDIGSCLPYTPAIFLLDLIDLTSFSNHKLFLGKQWADIITIYLPDEFLIPKFNDLPTFDLPKSVSSYFS